MGEDVDGDVMGYEDVGARRRGHMLRLPPTPGWRMHQVAPGIQAPREGQEILALTSTTGVTTLSNTVTSLVFTARPQRPFRAERLVATVARAFTAPATVVPTGTVLCSGIFIGTSIQQLTLGEFNIEIFGPTAFDMRLRMAPAAPGVDIQMSIRINVTPAAGQTADISLTLIGKSLAA